MEFDAEGMRRLALIISPLAGQAILECLEEIDRLRAAQPAPAPAWDGILHPSLQQALNALRMQAPSGLVGNLEHEVRTSFEALWTDKETLRRMYRVAQDRCDAIDAARPDPFAPVQAEPTDGPLQIAIDALESIALAGMSGSGQESEEGMRDWHARRAWEFIGIAARARAAMAQAKGGAE